MIKFDDYLKSKLNDDPELKEEYNKFEPEFSAIQTIIDVRTSSGITQKGLAERTGINQVDISKFERGNANPSLMHLNEELEDDIYCERLLDEYLEDPDPDKHDAMSLEDFAQSEGIDV
ncbi:MAG TPA: helix-turn-helix transcriptional regulator [Candidatus Avilachnospira avicola]|nr:helix-turn-helix transcriptional regulator [Candidatus Avilachnospira avicola]